MFVNVNAHPGSRPKVLGQLGELSRARADVAFLEPSRLTVAADGADADAEPLGGLGAVKQHGLWHRDLRH